MISVEGKTYKVVVVTPAGRKRYMEVLLKYILKNRSIIDEYCIWQNTKNIEDINYFKTLTENYNFIKVKESKIPINGGWSIHKFFVDCVDKDTIYIRLDDDIVYLEDNFFIKLLLFRIHNPQYFLVFPNIINNAIIDHIHQRMGVYEIEQIFDYSFLSKVGWADPYLAQHKHDVFVNNISNNMLDIYRFNRWELFFYERISINCISWFGEEFAKFEGNVGVDEEQWLSQDKPKNIKKMNCVFGDAICSHFAFYTQREFLDSTNTLQKYKELINF